MSGSVVFAFLGARHKRYNKRRGCNSEEIVALDWRPVPLHEGADRLRRDEHADSVKWCESATMADLVECLGDAGDDLPFGAFVAIVRLIWTQGMEDCDERTELIAYHPVSLLAWDTGFLRSTAATLAEFDDATNETHCYWEARCIEDDARGPLTAADAERVAVIDSRVDAAWSRLHALQDDDAVLVLGPLSRPPVDRCPACRRPHALIAYRLTSTDKVGCVNCDWHGLRPELHAAIAAETARTSP